jgi:hypothetical protein
MGVRLVGAALNPAWAGLSDRARLVLLQMCYVARDQGTSTQAARLYFGGHKALIISVLGKDPDTLTRSNLETSEKVIARVVKELKSAGAVVLVSSSAPGRTAIYEVHPERFPNLNQDPLPVDNSQVPRGNGGHPAPPNGGHPAPPISEEWGVAGDRNGGHPAPPRGEHRGEQKSDLKRNHPTQPPAQLSPAAPSTLWKTR